MIWPELQKGNAVLIEWKSEDRMSWDCSRVFSCEDASFKAAEKLKLAWGSQYDVMSEQCIYSASDILLLEQDSTGKTLSGAGAGLSSSPWIDELRRRIL